MSKKKGHILAVVGAQYGSEGKGVIVSHLANTYDIHVRTGGPNAGHSIVYRNKIYKMQVIPCGWVNKNARLIIGRGALVDIQQLKKELELIRQVDESIECRLFIDAKAGVLDERHHKAEGGTAGEMHRKIGSTGEGVGAARIARISRDPAQFCHFGDVAAEHGLRHLVAYDTPATLAQAHDHGANILLEGTQGSGLSLIHGPWPYVTSTDTNAAQLAADAGIAPNRVDQILLVARTYPIRVAGNSGPLKGEITWDELSARIGKKVIEQTTVTRKIRRVGEWDEALIDSAVTLNNPTGIALTFLDYLFPEDGGKSNPDELSHRAKIFIYYMERRWKVPVVMVGTGGLITEENGNVVVPWQIAQLKSLEGKACQ